MNTIVWMTFALTVIVAPMLSFGVGVLLAPSQQRAACQPRPTTLPAIEPVAFTATAPAEVPSVASISRPLIYVEPRPGGRWAVRKDGATRASRVFELKQDAVDRAQTLAGRERAELVIAG